MDEEVCVKLIMLLSFLHSNFLFLLQHSYVLYDHVYDNIQTAVTPTGHDCMFNFLAEIQLEQRLSFSTLLHSMHLFDYILSKITIHRYDFLLIGCTCLFLVSKLEEIYVSIF